MRSALYRRVALGLVAVACLSAPFLVWHLLNREYLGESPKSGFNQQVAKYPSKDYEPKSPPIDVPTPTITVDHNKPPLITLVDLPPVDGLGRMDLSGDLVFGKKIQADILLTAIILLPSVDGKPPQAVASVAEMLTPHKHHSFKLKLPIPALKGIFPLRVELLSPDLTPMQSVVAEGRIEIR